MWKTDILDFSASTFGIAQGNLKSQAIQNGSLMGREMKNHEFLPSKHNKAQGKQITLASYIPPKNHDFTLFCVHSYEAQGKQISPANFFLKITTLFFSFHAIISLSLEKSSGFYNSKQDLAGGIPSGTADAAIDEIVKKCNHVGNDFIVHNFLIIRLYHGVKVFLARTEKCFTSGGRTGKRFVGFDPFFVGLSVKSSEFVGLSVKRKHRGVGD